MSPDPLKKAHPFDGILKITNIAEVAVKAPSMGSVSVCFILNLIDCFIFAKCTQGFFNLKMPLLH